MTRVPPWLGWSFVAATGYVSFSWFANRAIYYPMKYPQGSWDAQVELGAADVWLAASDGVKLHGWWVEAPGARAATLFLHGNAGNLSHRGNHMRAITAAGSSVLVLDYRGYGRSEGRPTESGLYADADAAFEWLGARHSRVVIHGESLGAAVAVDLASRRKCAGLVLEAPFSSASAVAGTVLPGVGRLLVRGYDSKSKIGRVQAPLLVIHGDRDEVIDYSLGRDLFAAAPEPKQFWTIAGGHHNNLIEAAGAEYGRRLAAFYSALP